MRINDVLQRKGSDVVTVRSDLTVRELVQVLAEHGIGAAVVSDDPDSGVIAGIVSERDVVRLLAREGDWGDASVASVMTADVVTGEPDAQLEDVARQLTDRRIRHLPVVQDGRMIGIVSIGDVVKHRIDELQTERDQLTSYIHG